MKDEGVYFRLKEYILGCLRGFEYVQMDIVTDIGDCRSAFATAEKKQIFVTIIYLLNIFYMHRLIDS